MRRALRREHCDCVADFTAENILACSNGLLHLPTLTLRSHTPAFFTYNALDFAFAPAAPEPRQWLEFLGQLWPEDQEAIDTLQEVFGYCLTGDTGQQKAFLLVGPKRSGKGTIARVLARLVGIGNAVAPTLAGLGTNFGLAPLIGKRVAIISDARLGARADQHAITERLLSITGEDAITIDRKYLPAWTGQLQTRFLVISNELPRLADASGALASRFIVLLLSKSFYGREDQTLTSKLLTELPGILNWAIEGWRRLSDRGYFVQPRSAVDAVQQLEELGSPIMAFVANAATSDRSKAPVLTSYIRLGADGAPSRGRIIPASNRPSVATCARWSPGCGRCAPEMVKTAGAVIRASGSNEPLVRDLVRSGPRWSSGWSAMPLAFCPGFVRGSAPGPRWSAQKHRYAREEWGMGRGECCKYKLQCSGPRTIADHLFGLMAGGGMPESPTVYADHLRPVQQSSAESPPLPGQGFARIIGE